MTEGKLFYVTGPSGSGKDSLIRYARERLASNSGVVFAHRYITRPAEPSGENHIALSKAEFEVRLKAGLFAMHWRSHDLSYGIGREIDFWLSRGCSVVINGSREYLPHARHLYPALTVIAIAAPPELLAARLRARGRETEDEIAERIDRAKQFPLPDGPLELIQNDADLATAGERLIHILTAASSSKRGVA